MKKLIILTGPMGVGKTTVGKTLSNYLGRTAFIDGDWCIDLHPFIGNKETKGIAINNIIHMIRNYFHCTECDYIVLSWVMSQTTNQKIIMGVSDLDLTVYNLTLTCDEEALRNRWKSDQTTEWRNEEWLQQSIESIKNYNNRSETIIIDTSHLTIPDVVERIEDEINKMG